MGTTLFVANLSNDVNDESLAQLFTRAGTVTSAHVVTDKFSGQSRRYGFVEMHSEAEAAQAITLLNGQHLDGRALVVKEARPREEPRGGYGGGRDSGERRSGGYGGGRDSAERRSGGYGGRSYGDRRSGGDRSRS